MTSFQIISFRYQKRFKNVGIQLELSSYFFFLIFSILTKSSDWHRHIYNQTV